MSDQPIILIRHDNSPHFGGLAAVEERHGKWMLYALTPCCGASGTGSDTETGVACRRCYATVQSYYGDFRIFTPDGPEQDDAWQALARWTGEPQGVLQELVLELLR